MIYKSKKYQQLQHKVIEYLLQARHISTTQSLGVVIIIPPILLIRKLEQRH